MKIRRFSLFCFLFLIFLMSFLFASCATTTSGGSALNGQTLMQDRCTACHSLERVISAHKTGDEWKITVDRMMNRGVQLTPQEEQALITYLAQNYK
jgi:hypothetical protein